MSVFNQIRNKITKKRRNLTFPQFCVKKLCLTQSKALYKINRNIIETKYAGKIRFKIHCVWLLFDKFAHGRYPKERLKPASALLTKFNGVPRFNWNILLSNKFSNKIYLKLFAVLKQRMSFSITF